MPATDLPTIELSSSALLRMALRVPRFNVSAYVDPNPAEHADEQAEAEAFVAAAVQLFYDDPGAADGLEPYLEFLFLPEELEKARKSEDFPRLLGFAALQRAIDDALDRLDDQLFDPPSHKHPVFARLPALFERLDRDNLLPLVPDYISHQRHRNGHAMLLDGVAFFPHPLLASQHELIAELFGLTGRPDLSVSIAVHPFRVEPAGSVQDLLLEDYWRGIQLTRENLDSLDRHDTGVQTFHAAQQGTVERLFRPLLGTWFDWDRRSRYDPNDPVKRLYIREVKPATNRHGEPLVAAWNRELHAERDTAAKRFTHVDGKVARYTADDYAPTPEQPNADPGAPDTSRKLWRVDGPLSDETWLELVGHFFRGNELIGEHFQDAFPSLKQPAATA